MHGRDIKRFLPDYKDQWIIFTRRGIEIAKYNGIEEYLKPFYDDLKPKKSIKEARGRKPGPYKWYEIQDNVAYYNEFDSEKIVWGNLNIGATFSYDNSGMYINAPSNILTSTKNDIKYLLAILNSKVISYMMKRIGYCREHGYVEYKKVFVEQLPIPKVSEGIQKKFEVLIDKLLQIKKKGDKTDKLENELDEMVFDLFKLSDSEIEFLKADLVSQPSALKIS